MKLSFIIYGPPRTKKNSQEIWKTPAGRSFIAPSKYYRDYAKDFIKQVRAEWRQHIDERVNAKYVYYMPNNRVVDLVGLEQATNDLLVKAGVLKDDNTKVVATHDGSCVYVDKANPRVEIEIRSKVEGRYDE